MKRIFVIAVVLVTFLLSSLPGSLTVLLPGSLTVLAQTQTEKEEAEARRAEFKKKARTLVASDEERAPYADFLKSRHTGLIRLLPREKYTTEAYADVMGGERPATPGSFQRKLNEEGPGSTLPGPVGPRGSETSNPSPNQGVLTNLVDLPSINPNTGRTRARARDGGAYYSFTRLTHAYGYGSDLSLERGQFQVGFAGVNYGFLTNLGDVPLETVDLDTPAAKLLEEYIPAEKELDARSEHRRFGQGVTIDGLTVKSSLPMRLNSTYLLRAINYDQADVLVAFRVVEIDSDGTPLILWKRLKRFSTPLLARKY
jgi:hypothetical protein